MLIWLRIVDWTQLKERQMRQTEFSVVNRLGAFLQSVDACKVSCEGMVGNTLRIVVVPTWQKHLQHVMAAISGDSALMREIGADPRDIEICGELIYIPVIVREEDPRAA